ncbi:MAG: FeoB-associated Cys-rich membrane protein [Bacteroidetes bacterium]|nr:FeoB-associated Cys-rich membrane protein [Bacteroidota bacterium]
MLLLQYIIIALLALAALFFIFKKLKAQVTAEDCGSGCGKCGIAKSFDDIHG